MTKQSLTRRALLTLIAGIALVPAIARPQAAHASGPITLQTWSHPGDARWGGGGNTASRAWIYVRATRTSNGVPITNLGPENILSQRPIELPEGWRLRTLDGPHPEAWLLPLEFANLGSGVYRFKIAPFRYWRPGAYNYVIELRGGFIYASTTGTLEIPL